MRTERKKKDNLDSRKEFINKFSGAITISDEDDFDPKSIWKTELEE